MNRSKFSVLVFFGCLSFAGAAWAQATVECVSHNYKYTQCYAPLEEPQLIYQKSQSACIVNRTWGFNPKKHRIWVNDGCSGVFADPDGYYYGRKGGFDKGARHYGPHGHDAGAMVTGAVVGALIAQDMEKHKKHKKHYTTSNAPIDTRPQFDKEGNPNFDTHGNYQGCHGIGCQVDNPRSGH
ncbi:MAG TPA: DUF3011 domain-containing protein [Burkholderiaceae bacterium]|nr:DUF3011 domain-containing protein [Burkholderiaceae bacterium]